MEPHKDIVKMGHLRRLKTMKKKWFVLWQEGINGPSRLEYYDSEKKFRNNMPAKRGIEISSCFNINKKSDTKHKHAIALFTKEDCFAVVCETAEEQQSWLNSLLQLWSYSQDGSPTSRPLFEHVWQVTVKSRGLASSAGIAHGAYRLCLTNSALSLIRLHQEEPEVSFQLASIRRCGFSDCFFFMEVGRMAATGPGELWMQVEDTVIAHNMHDVILSSMRASNATAEQPSTFRPRSRSSVGEKTRPAGSGRAGPGYEASTLPKRSKTISEPHVSSPLRNTKSPGSSGRNSSFRTSSTFLPRSSPGGATSPLSQTMLDSDIGIRLRTDSMESRGSHGTASSSYSVEDYEDQVASGSTSTRSVTPEGPMIIRDNPDYLAMSPIGKAADMVVSPGLELPPSTGGYMEMSPGLGMGDPSSESTGYMDMTPGQQLPDPYMDMSRASYSASPAPSTASSLSNADAEDKGYLDMTPVARSLPTVQERMALDAYMETSPGNQSPRVSHLLRPDKVYSFLVEGSERFDEFPKRAYSVGSKPAVVRSKDKNILDESSMPLDAGAKSSSAPYLPDEFLDKVPSAQNMVKADSSKKGKNENNGHFMEMDFMRPRTDSTSSYGSKSSLGGSKDFRSRTSSLGQQDFRPRTSSAGNIPRIPGTNINKTERAMISKEKGIPDSIRPRTSSCGQDYRPRAASWGNSKHKKYGKNSSQESLTKTLFNSIRRKSQELIKGHSKSGYMDMTNATSTPRSCLESHIESSYIDMAPQIVAEITPKGNKVDELLDVRIGAPVYSSTPEQKEKGGYMEMQRVSKDKSVDYANLSYGAQSGSVALARRNSGHRAQNSLVEEMEPFDAHRNLPIPMETDETVSTHTVIPSERVANFSIGESMEIADSFVESRSKDDKNIAQEKKMLSSAAATDNVQIGSTNNSISGCGLVSKPLPVPAVIGSAMANTGLHVSKAEDIGQYMTLSFDIHKSPSSKNSSNNNSESEKRARSSSEKTGATSQKAHSSRMDKKVSTRSSKTDTLSIDTSRRVAEKRKSPKSPITVNTDLADTTSESLLYQKKKSPKSPGSLSVDPFALGTSPMKLRSSTSPSPSAAKSPKKLDSQSSTLQGKGNRSAKSPIQDTAEKRTSTGMLHILEKSTISRKVSSSSLPGSVDRRTSSSGSDADNNGSSNRNSLPDGPAFSELGATISRNSSKTSLGSEKELNYIDLHHVSSEDSSKESSKMNRSRNSGSKTSLSAQGEDEDSPLFYAEIDFAKSEGLKHSASAKEVRFPPR